MRLRLGRDRASDLGFALVLTVAWVLFWGDISVANVLSGAAAALLLLSVFPPGHDVAVVHHRLRPVAAVRLGLFFFAELVLSTLVMVRDVAGGPSRERPGVVACPLRVGAPGLITFLTNLLAMSPGMMPIDVTEDPPVIYLHVLRLDDPDAVRMRVSRFEALAVAALGDAEALAAVGRPAPPPPHRRPGVGS